MVLEKCVDVCKTCQIPKISRYTSGALEMGGYIVLINLVSPLDFFPHLFLNSGLVGRMKKIASGPKLEAVTPGAILKIAPIT